jgi:hypothetical protein
MRSLARRPSLLFGMSALAIVGLCVAVLRSQAFAANPDLAAWGVTFDLTISIPLLYWFFVVRTGRARALTIAPVFLAGMMLATRLVPGPQQQFVRQLGLVLVPLAELLLIGALVRRVIAARKERSTSADPYERIAAAAKTLAGEGIIADVITSEIATFYYALFGWRQQPEPRERAVTFHQRNGWGTILICIFVLIAAEGLAMHLFLARWSTLVAWGWTALDLWAVLWLLGDYQGLRLRRSWIDDDALHIRYGLRWTLTIPRDLIASIDEIRNESEWKRKDVLKIAILDEPRWLITLREPMTARGMAGLRKEVRALAVLPDRDEWIELIGC